MQTRSIETRHQILEAAYREFSKYGYQAASLDEICASAGVSKGALYHHFPSKQAVFLAILDEWLAQLDHSFTLARMEAHTIPEAMLKMADMAGGAAQSADVRLTIMLEFWLQAARDPVIWAAAVAPYRRYTDYLVELIQHGVNEGSLRNVDAQAAARAIVALAMGLLMQAMFDPQSTDWANEAHQAVELLINGLGKESHEFDNRGDRSYWKRTGTPIASKWSGSKGSGFTR